MINFFFRKITVVEFPQSKSVLRLAIDVLLNPKIMRGKYYSSILKVLIFIIDFWLIEMAFRAANELGFAKTIPIHSKSLDFHY